MIKQKQIDKLLVP